MEYQDEVLRLLKSIDASLKVLAKQQKGHDVADDRDLDSQWGNPTVKFNPRDWTGPSFKGRAMSECDPDFLEMLASTFDYFADQAEEKNERTDAGKPTAPYKRKDAARARGWAKRIRDGKVPAAATGGDDPDWSRRDDEDGWK